CLSSIRRHTRLSRDWSSDLCSHDLPVNLQKRHAVPQRTRHFVINHPMADLLMMSIETNWRKSVTFTPGAQRHNAIFGNRQPQAEIGRASCRERDETSKDTGNIDGND